MQEIQGVQSNSPSIVHFIKTDFKDIKIMEWILASPEINIIESLWSIVKRNLITNKVNRQARKRFKKWRFQRKREKRTLVKDMKAIKLVFLSKYHRSKHLS